MTPTIEKISARQRSQVLHERMRGLVHRIGPGGKFPKVTELCRELGVSPTTLNGVLRDLEEDGLIVRRHAVGIFVADAPPVTRHRAMVCHPSFLQAPQVSPFWSMLMDGIRARSAERGEAFDFYLSNPDHADQSLPLALMDDIRGGRIAGVLGVGLHGDAWWMMQQRVPVVTLFGKGHVIVNLNGERQMQLAASTLQKHGCRNLALCARAWPFHEPSKLRREVEREAQMWQSTLLDLGLKVRRSWMKPDESRINDSELRSLSLQEQGFRAVMQLFQERAAKPDGLYFNDDNQTQGALVALHRLGIRVGHDVAVATLANTGSKALWGHEDDMILLQYDPAHFIEVLFKGLDDLLSGRRPLQEDQMELVEPQLREPLERT
jgi:DNA-binding LacI/PurR family transcriptional regulator